MTGSGVQLDLAGQTALVTGASRDIARDIARILALAGADVIGIGTRIEADDGGRGAELASMGRDFHPVNCDLAERVWVRAMRRKLDTRGLAGDILVNNAGIIRRARLTDHADEDWDTVMPVNLDANLLLARVLVRRMVKRGRRKIFFCCLGVVFPGLDQRALLRGQQGAIAHLTRALANQGAAPGAKVNAVAPAYIDPTNTAALKADTDGSAAPLARVPAGRWGAPADIAGPVLFFASDLARFVHGAILPAYGGWLARWRTLRRCGKRTGECG